VVDETSVCAVDAPPPIWRNARVLVHRATAAAMTWFVALALALAVPVSQLRTVTIVQTCCCPDPARCHCPDHEQDSGRQPTLKACHQERDVFVSASVVEFTLPTIPLRAPSRTATLLPPNTISSPHAEPALERPAAPS
jgi:hypothetical protein